jgi:Domain of unknown function (DUF4398)
MFATLERWKNQKDALAPYFFSGTSVAAQLGIETYCETQIHLGERNALMRRSSGISLNWRTLSFVCGILVAGGCSSARPPTATVAQAELAVKEAGQSKAPEYAAGELNIAREKFDRAKRAMDKEDYEEARRLAEEALVDAQLAETKADAESTRNAAQELRKTLDSLRGEAERQSRNNY